MYLGVNKNAKLMLLAHRENLNHIEYDDNIFKSLMFYQSSYLASYSDDFRGAVLELMTYMSHW